MTKPNMAKIVKTATSYLSKHSPKILMGVGIAGMVTTTVLAVKATPKALKLLEEEENKKQEPLTKMESVKAAWKPYIPAVVTGVVSAGCLIGSSSVSTRRAAALAAAYQISETALAEYREAAFKTVGERKEKIIREQVSRDRVEQTPVNKNEVVITKRGQSLFMDPLSKRYFKSDVEEIKRIVNVLNKRMIHDISGCISLSELYDEIGLERTDISDELGWRIDDLGKDMIEIEFHPIMAEDNQPCLALYYVTAPRWAYDGSR